MVDLSDRRRSGRRLVGSLRTRNRSSRRRVISSTDSVLVRAAASSMARGRPSRERHRSSTLSLSTLAVRPTRWAVARRVNSSTASERANGASSKTTSPSMSSGTWLVHRIRSAGAASRRRTARAAAASRTCSQLSRITTAAVDLNRSKSASSPPGPPTALTSTSTTSSAVIAVSSLANQTPSVDEASRRPTAIATAVFPIPPGPTISTSRSPASRSETAATSFSRPTSAAVSDGRFPVERVASTRAGRREARSSDGSWTRIRCSSSCSCGRGSSPSSSASWFLTRWYVARASAWRPARYRR